jgi:hypothetical protein
MLVFRTSALKMKAVCSSEILSSYKSTWRYNPEDQYRLLHLRENIKSLIYNIYSKHFSVAYGVCKYRMCQKDVHTL